MKTITQKTFYLFSALSALTSLIILWGDRILYSAPGMNTPLARNLGQLALVLGLTLSLGLPVAFALKIKKNPAPEDIQPEKTPDQKPFFLWALATIAPVLIILVVPRILPMSVRQVIVKYVFTTYGFISHIPFPNLLRSDITFTSIFFLAAISIYIFMVQKGIACAKKKLFTGALVLSVFSFVSGLVAANVSWMIIYFE